MQNEHLWCVNNSGGIFQLNIKTHQWYHFGNDQYEVTFKRVSTSPLSIWSVGGDHQIYVYVPVTDIPIRVCAVTYENSRWNPLTQFSSTLLPTDRHQWSSCDGSEHTPKESFLLPSKSWKWESEWYIDNNIEGEPLGPEGWTYATDFPMQYSVDRKWNTFVRRRKWVRFRRYFAVNQWALIESIHGDHVAEPFIDIATGGYEIPGGIRDSLAVWAVTVMGRVVFRTGVERLSPEGVSWRNVEVPSGWEVNQISCGPSGLVWAIAWDGSALVRSGVTRENLCGNTWLRLEPPNESKLMQVSVGVDAVWAITRDGRVYFRKGVRGLNAGHNDASATGSGWVEMVHHMALVSVTANDQVWALSSDHKAIHFRTGISYGELTGKSWKMVSQLPINPVNHINDRNNCLSLSLRKTSNDKKNLHPSEESLSSLESSVSTCNNDDEHTLWLWISSSCCTINADIYLKLASTSSGGSLPSIGPSIIDGSVFTDNGEDTSEWRTNIMTQLQDRYEKEMKDFQEYHTAIESGTWIKSGTCFVNVSNGWSLGHLELERQGVEGGTESGTLNISHSSTPLSSPSKANNKMILNLAEIICVLCDVCEDKGSNIGSNCLVIVTNKERIRIGFRAETELYDWISSINLACGDIHGINGNTASSGACLWTLTNNGEVYLGHKIQGTDCKSLFYYHLGGGHFQQLSVSSGVAWALTYDGTLWVFTNGYGGGIYKGISGANKNCNIIYDTISMMCYENQRWNPLMGFSTKILPTDRYLWSDETGKIECPKDSIRLPSLNWQWITDWNIDYSTPDGVDTDGYQYAFDFPFPFHSDRRFNDFVRRRRWYRKCKLTTSGPWSDIGHQTPMLSVSLNSSQNNCDNTNHEIPICAWAVSIDGDALCRNGVTSRNPRGLTWTHVPCEQPLVNISVGVGEDGNYHVWSIANDGTAFLRHGIGPKSPSGTVWFHVEPPRPKCPLKRICVGKSTVWAIDAKRRLWFRAEIVPAFPEGTHWKKVCDDCHHMAIDCDDKLWAILTKTHNEIKCNVLAKRITDDSSNKFGYDWDYGADHLNYFNYLCVTNFDEKSKDYHL